MALTRARTRLYLPLLRRAHRGREAAQNEQLREELLAAHRRLSARATGGCARSAPERSARRLFETLDVPVASRSADDGDGIAARAAAALRGWRPTPARSRRWRPAPIPSWRGSGARTRGAVLTSYSRIKQAHGGYQPPTEIFDEVARGRWRAARPARRDPRGTATRARTTCRAAR